MNERFVFHVREVNVVDVDVAVRVGQFLKTCVGGLILRFEKVENSACRSGRALKLGYDARYFVERFGVLRCVGKHARERADRERAHAGHYAAFYHEINAQHAYDDVYHVVDESRAGVDHCRIESGVLSPNFEVAVYNGKSVLGAFFIAENFDDALI